MDWHDDQTQGLTDDVCVLLYNINSLLWWWVMAYLLFELRLQL